MKSITLLILVCLVLFGCATTSLPPVSKEFRFEGDERRLWLRSEEEQSVLNRSGIIYRDEELEAYLNTIARKLQPEQTSAHIPIKIMVIKNHLLNAFAYPNGVIYLHTGIIARMENEAQLATLLAHEMTHVTHRHLLRRFRDIKNKTAFLVTLQVTTGGLAGIGELAILIGAIGTLSSVSGYSKELETEADTEGFQLMIRSGYAPEEAPKLFTHLKKEVEEDKRKEPFFFGTHPRLQERIENYETALKTINKQQKEGNKNTDVFFQKTCRVMIDNASLDLKAGRFKIAQQAVENYIAIKQNDAKAYYLLGEIYRQKGGREDFEKPKEYYQRAVSLDPSYPDPYKGLGLIYLRQGEKTLAKNSFETYLLLSPQASDRGHIENYITRCNEGGDK
jgi:predicted Zn-dependent protease